MDTMEGVLKELQDQRASLQQELGRLDAALSALQTTGISSTNGRRAPRPAASAPTRSSRPPLSPAARKRIALAQQKRWAKFRAAKKEAS